MEFFFDKFRILCFIFGPLTKVTPPMSYAQPVTAARVNTRCPPRPSRSSSRLFPARGPRPAGPSLPLWSLPCDLGPDLGPRTHLLHISCYVYCLSPRLFFLLGIGRSAVQGHFEDHKPSAFAATTGGNIHSRFGYLVKARLDTGGLSLEI